MNYLFRFGVRLIIRLICGKAEALKEAESSVAKRKKTVAELDEELRLKLEGISGDGGVSGLELENGKAVAMKRGVKENVFRLI